MGRYLVGVKGSKMVYMISYQGGTLVTQFTCGPSNNRLPMDGVWVGVVSHNNGLCHPVTIVT
jgi:hypothetical protein